MTSFVVLVIAGSFLGLFTMQADHYVRAELEDLADAITDLVAEVDKLTCRARLEVNWTSEVGSHGLPRYFHGEPYLIRFSPERPYLVWKEIRVEGRFFTSSIRLHGPDGTSVGMLDVPSTMGFVIETSQHWDDWGLGQTITIGPLSP